MSASVPRVVFDCNVFLQALLSGDGPAFRCLLQVEHKRIEILLSEEMIAEARDVLNRPAILRKNPEVTPVRIAQILDFMIRRSSFVEIVPKAFPCPRDPKDEPYLNLAIAGKAQYLVTRDLKHLLKFAQKDSVESNGFRQSFPDIQIIDPPTFLREIQSHLD